MKLQLLKKELRLCSHPAAWLMLLLSSMALIPNYPYPVIYFYLTLGVFFICLSGRENNDVTFTMTLPVSRRDLVRARFSFVILLEAIELALVAVFVVLHGVLYGPDAPGNAAGMDANLALVAEGFLFFGAYHLVFFPSYYRNVDRVGTSFVKSSVALGVLTVVDIVLSYALPFWRDRLDTPDPQNTGAKLVFLAVCVVFYCIATALSFRTSVRRFEQLDLK